MRASRTAAAASLAASLLMPVWAPGLNDDGFERYAVILSRMPFGEPPIEEEVAPTPQPVTTESFASSFRVCSITKSLGGGPIKVGIVDKADKNAVIMLIEGEENEDGITLVSADLLEEEAVLQKGAEIALLKLGGEPAAKLSPRDLARRKTPTRAASYADRRRERREELMKREQQKAPVERPPPKYTGAELRQHLQEYNMTAIREGLPALPIELTPAQDNQLVQEGVLPPPGGPPGPSPQELAPLLEGTRAGSLIEGLPAELQDLKLEDLSTEDLQMLLRQ